MVLRKTSIEINNPPESKVVNIDVLAKFMIEKKDNEEATKHYTKASACWESTKYNNKLKKNKDWFLGLLY